MLHDEISNHIVTKQELFQRENELSESVDANNANIENSRIEYFRQRETITKLTDELAQEVDEHAQAGAALRKLEDKIEKLQSELNKLSKNREDLSGEKESLCERLEDAEQEIDTLNKMIKTQNEKLLHYEKKHTELASLDKSLLKTRVKELEGIITGNEKVISLLEDQVSNISQISSQSVSSSPDTINISHLTFPFPPSSLATTVVASLQADTPTSSNLKDITVDQNYNTNYSLPKSQASSLDTAISLPSEVQVNPSQFQLDWT